jgi:hypothetical protein
MKSNQILLLLLFFLCSAACASSELGQKNSTPPPHKIFDELLKKHVSNDGIVDYKGFINDKEKLETYLSLLSNNAPDRENWSKNEQLAYWINVYNAFTIKLIVDNYPVNSIQDLHPTIKIPLVNTVWHKKFFKIGGKDASLDEVEHKILRKEFDEPRIHFAVNCASYSCPPLLNEAFVPEKIDQQLDSQAKKFINDKRHNKISANEIEISQIFSWFKGDFTQNGNLIDYLNKYSNVKISSGAKISNMEYDWSLNE